MIARKRTCDAPRRRRRGPCRRRAQPAPWPLHSQTPCHSHWRCCEAYDQVAHVHLADSRQQTADSRQSQCKSHLNRFPGPCRIEFICQAELHSILHIQNNAPETVSQSVWVHVGVISACLGQSAPSLGQEDERNILLTLDLGTPAQPALFQSATT